MQSISNFFWCYSYRDRDTDTIPTVFVDRSNVCKLIYLSSHPLKLPLLLFWPIPTKLPRNLSVKRCYQCIVSREPNGFRDHPSRYYLCSSARPPLAAGERRDATHRRARGANYVCGNMRLELERRCPIQTSSSAAETTGEINRATCNNCRE